ncbi:hypothetical protein [Ferruginibacter sp.]|uniref:hypothetical protein n=1 Tax=Ferruginibacter sp. TaxID=1940288 RepID=UPI0026585EA1|nr:hypothetical protein [Ferruginibacter sp.]
MPEEFTGYLNTWSAVRHYIKANQANPVGIIYPELNKLFLSQNKLKDHFPVLLRIAFVQKRYA